LAKGQHAAILLGLRFTGVGYDIAFDPSTTAENVPHSISMVELSS
jgi:hypothetical protein